MIINTVYTEFFTSTCWPQADKDWNVNPARNGSQAQCTPVGTGPGQRPGWRCSRQFRQSTIWRGGSYEPFVPPVDAIDRPCISGVTREAPWIKPPNFGQVN